MTIAQNQKMLQLQARIDALEQAFSILARAQHQDVSDRVLKLEGEIRAMKARMGKINKEYAKPGSIIRCFDDDGKVFPIE